MENDSDTTQESVQGRSDNAVSYVMMLLTGVLLIALPIATWPNSKFFAILYLPGIPVGLLLAHGGVALLWDAWRHPKR
jgi:hypothetical protein